MDESTQPPADVTDPVTEPVEAPETTAPDDTPSVALDDEPADDGDEFVPGLGGPIPHTENRSLPEHARAVGAGSLGPDGAPLADEDAAYNPQPQEPDPAAAAGIDRSHGLLPTLPPGAVAQPGAPSR